ncbi:MAG: zinc ribbon domain-containing protein [Endomicrobiaceae bacterium]|nr:zinc ribbon domain-containing protein [Endomicrobiaceae bacterium]
MPLFEFICEKCGKQFEKIVFSINNETIECPTCKSTDVKKQFSTFASSSSKSSSHHHHDGCCSSSAPSDCISKKMSGVCSGCCGM